MEECGFYLNQQTLFTKEFLIYFKFTLQVEHYNLQSVQLKILAGQCIKFTSYVCTVSHEYINYLFL